MAQGEYTSEFTGEQIDALLKKVEQRVSTPAPAEDKLITSGGVYTGLDGKVDKEAGKGLSTNDYTNTEKSKLGALPTNADLQTALGNKEDKSNKVTSFSSPTDTQYPSAKLVSDSLDAVKNDVSSLLSKAGIAEGIADTISAGTAQEFLQRQSGGDGVNCLKRIKGKTIAWNQLFDKSLLYPTQTYKGVTATGNKDTGEISFSGTSTGNEQFNLTAASQVKMVAGHKYLLRGATTNTPYLRLADQTAVFDTGNGLIWTCNASDRAVTLSCAIVSGRTYSGTIKVKVTDLTLMFGAGNEPSTVAEFEARYPGFHDYNPGILKNNDAAAFLTNGRNQWDEEYTSGNGNNGDIDYAQHFHLVSTNFIPVFPGQTYYFKSVTDFLTIYGYDSNKQKVANASLTSVQNATYTIPAGVYYIKFQKGGSNLAYNNDICINLSDPSFNGTYEPYWKRVLALRLSELTGIPEGGTEADRVTIFPNGLGGAGSAFDSLFVENGVTKAKGTMVRLTFNNSFTKRTDAQGSTFVTESFGALNLTSNLMMCPKSWDLTQSWITSMENKKMRIVNGTLAVRDDDYSTADAFNAAMNGGGIIAAAATPIVYTDLQYADGTPFTMPATILVDNGGVERIQAPEGATTPSAPFCCDSNYSISIANLVKKLADL